MEVIKRQRQFDPSFMKVPRELEWRVDYDGKIKEYKNYNSAFKFAKKVNADSITNTSKFTKKNDPTWVEYYCGKNKKQNRIVFNNNEPVDFKIIKEAQDYCDTIWKEENNMQEKIEEVVAAGEATAIEKTDSPYLKKDTPNYIVKLLNDKFYDNQCATKNFKHLPAALRCIMELGKDNKVEFTNNRDIFITKTKKGTVVRGTHWYTDSEMWFAQGTYTVNMETLKTKKKLNINNDHDRSVSWLDANMNNDQDRMLSYIKPHMTLKGE